MKKLTAILITVISVIVLMFPSTALAAKSTVATIQGGTILDSAGNVITVGYDQWGYNYQAHIFNGYYDNNPRPAVPVTSGDNLVMKWNDAWLANTDANGDHLLDRHYGFPTYIGSGAWLTNHQWGVYPDGTKWDYFSKIVAAPADATLAGGVWYAADGTVLGPEIWGEFIIIQEISNDPTLGEHGVLDKSPVGPGLGKW